MLPLRVSFSVVLAPVGRGVVAVIGSVGMEVSQVNCSAKMVAGMAVPTGDHWYHARGDAAKNCSEYGKIGAKRPKGVPIRACERDNSTWSPPLLHQRKSEMRIMFASWTKKACQRGMLAGFSRPKSLVGI